MGRKPFENRIRNARRRYTISPILVNIYRMGIMYYVVEVSKGANILEHGYDHDLTSLRKARKRAREMIGEFESKNWNNHIIWNEHK
jgi:hypothetical protein